jgi:hypothetical protein
MFAMIMIRFEAFDTQMWAYNFEYIDEPAPPDLWLSRAVGAPLQMAARFHDIFSIGRPDAIPIRRDAIDR